MSFLLPTADKSYSLGGFAEFQPTLLDKMAINASGRSQINDFITFVDRSYQTFKTLATTLSSRARRGCSMVPMASPILGDTIFIFAPIKRSPFDILYFTPAITSIMNLTDASLTLIPELAYSPMTNLELRFRPPVLLGRNGTEYGESKTNIRSNCECATTFI